MREFVFRGKPKNEADYEFLKMMYKDNCKDGFIYGSLVISHDKYYICIMALCQINSLVDNGNTTMFEVIPETVGEYTGLTDKNGTKIFEGDILRLAYHPEEDVIIEWHDGRFSFRKRNRPKDYGYESLCCVQITVSCLRVIGNIHDNPELLEG